MKRIGIVAFGFGSAASISSQRIAAIALRRARLFDAPIYTQTDVPIPLEQGLEINYILDEKPGKPPPTMRIARAAVSWARREGFKELYLIAAVPHLWRAERDTRRALREIDAEMKIHVCEEVYRYPQHSWFCPGRRKEQMRVRSRFVWCLREATLKLMPFWLYKIVAS